MLGISSVCFSACWTWVTYCSTRSAVDDTGVTATVAGSVRYLSASSRMSFGMVAEKNSVWRDFDGDFGRDLLREHVQIDGMPLHVVDTAGLRDSADPVEQEGIRRAWQAIEGADRLLLVVDDRRDVRHLARRFLEEAGAEVALAEDGQHAVEAGRGGPAPGSPRGAAPHGSRR